MRQPVGDHIRLQPQTQATDAQKGAAQAVPRVDVVMARGEEVKVYREVPAQTYARSQVDVRGRVDGYIEQWLFKPGQTVKAGQVLYMLDARPFRAQLAEAEGKLQEAQADLAFAENQVSLLEAQANLANATAARVKASKDYKRYKELVEEGAISRQDFDTATANLATADATVKARKAAVEQAQVSTKTQVQSAKAKVAAQKAIVDRARLNVVYSSIKAPISGLIGDSKVPVGGLVTANSETALTTIVPLDPIWVRFKVTEAQYLQYKKNHTGGPPPLQLYLADGSHFPYTGKVSNALNEIDRKTGTLEIQASFPNPQHSVLPGQFGRVKYVRDNRPNAITVPIKAVQQTQNLTSVFVVNAKNVVESRAVTLGSRVGEKFVVEEGISSGERIIVEGQLSVRPGMTVQPSSPRGGEMVTASGAQHLR